MNKCIFTGNLTGDPQVKYTTSGKAVCNVSLAMNRKFKNQTTGQSSEQVTFIDLVAWDKQAELMGEYLAKGSKIGVVARVRQESWEDRESGNKRNKIVFDVEEVEFLNTKKADGEGGGASSQPQTRQPETTTDDDSGSDDVPF